MKTRKRIPVIAPSAPLGQNGVDLIITDPNGSYTGTPLEMCDLPVQDADDL